MSSGWKSGRVGLKIISILHGVICQETWIFIYAVVKTSHLALRTMRVIVPPQRNWDFRSPGMSYSVHW